MDSPSTATSSAAAETARRAGASCAAGELEAAADLLAALLGRIEAGPPTERAAAPLVRLRLNGLERALGRELSRSAGEDEAASSALDPELGRALRSLRSCARTRVRRPAAARPPPIPFDGLLTLAKRQLKQRSELPLALEAAEQLGRRVDEVPGGRARVLALFQEIAVAANNAGRYPLALQAAQGAEELFAADTPDSTRMEILRSLALIQLQLGDRRQALATAGRAEQIARAAQDMEMQITMARLVAQCGDLERASESLRGLGRKVQSASDRLDLEQALGDLALRLGSPRRALEHLERALVGRKTGLLRADVLQLKGDAHRAAGDFPAAANAYREAYRLRRTQLGAEHPQSFRVQNAMGVLEVDLGDWQAADRDFDAAFGHALKSLGPEHPETLTLDSNRALARAKEQQDDGSTARYAEAVEKLASALGEDHPGVAALLRNLAHLELARGHEQRADALLSRALAAQQRSLGADHPDLAQTRLARGRLLARRGQLDAAAVEIDRAIEGLVKALGSAHPMVVRARTLRARLAAAQADGATAREQARQASMGIGVHIRRTFGAISGRQRGLLAQDAQDVVGALLSAPGFSARELFVILLPYRDSVLRSIAAGRSAARDGGGVHGFAKELKELRELYLAALHSRGADAAERARALADAIGQLEARTNIAKQADLNPEQVLQGACRQLPKHAALVKFVAYDRTEPGQPGRTRPAYTAFVLRRAGCAVQRVELSDAAGIDEAAESFVQAMRDQRSDAPKARRELGRLLLGPLDEALRGSQHWFVVPDASVWGVPLGVLPDPLDPSHYLLERVTVGYLTSTFELAELQPLEWSAKTPPPSLLVGAPAFGDGKDARPVVLTRTGPCAIDPFEPLPATRREIDDIAQLVPAPLLLTGAGATKQKLEAALAQKPWLVHFATHAYFAGLGECRQTEAQAERIGGAVTVAPNPLLLSGLALAGANTPAQVSTEGESGILTSYEVAGLDLSSTGLIVLSACDTGTGLRRRGQELQGLRWGFRAAGARALVTSLWRSNDVSTRRLMGRFYRALNSAPERDDPFRGAEALRAAQRAELESELRLGLHRPLAWANFIFSGVLSMPERPAQKVQ